MFDARTSPTSSSSSPSADPREDRGLTSTTPRLEVRQLRHAYGEREVLRGLSFSVAPGEVVGLLSPNGGGKSTALALLCGLLANRGGGQIVYEGRELAGIDRAYRAGLGVVFQHPSVDQKLSCRQNLHLALAMHGIFGEAAKRKIEEGLAIAGLSERGDEAGKTLSGGLLRRLDLVRAIAHDPHLLLLDEPTSGLDEGSFRSIWEAILELKKRRQMSIVVATHRPEEAARCDRLVIIHHGVAVADQSPAALVDEMREDMLQLQADDLEGLLAQLDPALAAGAYLDQGALKIPCEHGHEKVVRLVESLPAGRLRSVTLSRPNLGDVFLKLTGRSLDADIADTDGGEGQNAKTES